MTIDQEEIREWVEARGGRPATVKRTEKNGEPGVLRIDFPGGSGEDTLEEISWDEFFAKFEESNLAFVYQDEKASGEPSYFSKLVSRPDDMVQKGPSKARGATSKSAGAKGSHAKASHAKKARDEEGEGELDIEVEAQIDLDKEPSSAKKQKQPGAKPPHAKGTASKEEKSKGAEEDHSSHMTIDHEEIRAWVEARGGRPAAVTSTDKNGEPGILRIDFPGFSGEGTLEEISWDEFFAKFEESNLAFVYQQSKANGEPSYFSKLVSRPEDMGRKKAKQGKSKSRKAA